MNQEYRSIWDEDDLQILDDYDPSLIPKEGIVEILKYIPYFRDNKSFGKWEGSEGPSIGYPFFDDEADAFFNKCYQLNIIQPIEWSQWAQQNRDLIEFGEGIEDLDLSGIGKLLTSWFRIDRFNTGFLLGAMNEGLVLRALDHLSQVKPYT